MGDKPSTPDEVQRPGAATANSFMEAGEDFQERRNTLAPMLASKTLPTTEPDVIREVNSNEDLGIGIYQDDLSSGSSENLSVNSEHYDFLMVAMPHLRPPPPNEDEEEEVPEVKPKAGAKGAKGKKGKGGLKTQ